MKDSEDRCAQFVSPEEHDPTEWNLFPENQCILQMGHNYSHEPEWQFIRKLTMGRDTELLGAYGGLHLTREECAALLREIEGSE